MRRNLIPVIFFLSGAAGLVFEVVWSRQLVLVFGNTTQAVSAILTGFFGGMAIGSWYGGKLADRVYRPLRLYGILEVLLVGVVLLTPNSFLLIGEIYRSVFGLLEGQPAALTIVRLGLSLAALAPATIIMGATLPALTRYFARRATELNAAFSLLYVANTMGAVFGAAISGLVLIEIFGLSGTLKLGAACSFLAGSTAIVLDRSAKSADSPTRFAVAISTGPASRTKRPTIALTLAFLSGATSLGYQVLWMRLIASGTGSSTYIFTVVLTLFLIGLALGAVEYKRIRIRITDMLPVLAGGQVLLGVLGVFGMFLINFLDPLDGAFLWKSLAVVLPSTFVMGFTFPATTALLGGDDKEVGSRAGIILSANTIGAICATLIIPFVLIPRVGTPSALAIVALTNATTGVVLALRARGVLPFRRTFVIGGLATALLIGIATSTDHVFVDPGVARLRRIGAKLYQSREDDIASVQAGSLRGRDQLWVTGFSMTVLTSDAKLMPILPLVLRPDSRTILVVAFGMGSTFRAALIAGLNVDAVELVPSVPDVFDSFYKDAAAVRANSRGRIIIADGRSHVELTDRRYDIIVVDPPPPLESAGVSVISSKEFYEACYHRLTPGGVMMQWVPWVQPIADFKSHVRTFRSVFKNVLVAAGPGGNGFYMLGSDSELNLNDSSVRKVLARPGIVSDLSSAYDSPATTLIGWASLLPTLVRLRRDEVGVFAGPGPLITDDRPLPEYFLLRRRTAESSKLLNPRDVRAVPR